MIAASTYLPSASCEHDRGLEHPRNRRPELAQRHAQAGQRSYPASRWGRTSPAGAAPRRSSGRSAGRHRSALAGFGGGLRRRTRGRSGRGEATVVIRCRGGSPSFRLGIILVPSLRQALGRPREIGSWRFPSLRRPRSRACVMQPRPWPRRRPDRSRSPPRLFPLGLRLLAEVMQLALPILHLALRLAHVGVPVGCRSSSPANRTGRPIRARAADRPRRAGRRSASGVR